LSDGAPPWRYRLHFADGGHRRAQVWRIAAAVHRLAPELLNDPKASPFQLEIFDRRPGLKNDAPSLELVPPLIDPRFSYHQKDVPAASHPPVAAALSFLAEIGADDVVWDPFTGSGSELIEVALRTPCRRILGTDLDAAALAVARHNIEVAALPKNAIEL